MIILHDGTSSDLSHVQAMANIEDGFALFDYVRINQKNGAAWIGQILEPNRNISIVNSNRLDPTILHGLKLIQEHPDVQSVESVQIFEIGILGEYDEGQLLTSRLRPLPGSVVEKLNEEETSRVISLPQKLEHANGSSNVIGELLNAAGVPLCIDALKFNYHIMVAGGTGSGKSNVSANLVEQALEFDKFVLLHDAKPDYAFVHEPNTDKGITSKIWKQFEKYRLQPRGVSQVKRIGFYGLCDPNKVDSVVGFHASDFAPEILSALFFPYSNEHLQFEAFASAGENLRQKLMSAELMSKNGQKKDSYSINDILELVTDRITNPKVDPLDQINKLVGQAILRKITNRRRGIPWLDVIGQNSGKANNDPFKSASLDQNKSSRVERFDLQYYVNSGHLLVIDYSRMDAASYALILSYFLRICQGYCKKRNENTVGIVQMVDEAHRIFDNDSQHSSALERDFERVMREGRSVDHSIILSLQNASQIPPRVMNNLNTKFVMRQNSKAEADAATQTMGKEFSPQAMKLGTGHALVGVHEAKATVLAQMAPSPFELMRTDNTGK